MSSAGLSPAEEGAPVPPPGLLGPWPRSSSPSMRRVRSQRRRPLSLPPSSCPLSHGVTCGFRRGGWHQDFPKVLGSIIQSLCPGHGRAPAVGSSWPFLDPRAWPSQLREPLPGPGRAVALPTAAPGGPFPTKPQPEPRSLSRHLRPCTSEGNHVGKPAQGQQAHGAGLGPAAAGAALAPCAPWAGSRCAGSGTHLQGQLSFLPGAPSPCCCAQGDAVPGASAGGRLACAHGGLAHGIRVLPSPSPGSGTRPAPLECRRRGRGGQPAPGILL